MKLYRFWLGILACMVVFFYTASISVQSSPTHIKTQDYNALYFNGYLNFCFNGLTKLVTGDKLRNNVDDYSQPNPDYGYVVAKKADTRQLKKENDTIQDKLEITINKVLKNLVGKDLNDVKTEVNTFPLQ